MDAPPKFKGTTVSYILEGTDLPGFGKMHTDPKYKLKLSEAAPLSSWWGSSWCTRCIRGSSKTVKNHNMFSNELDVELHPTPWHVSCWGTTWTESAVHSLVHPKIGSNHSNWGNSSPERTVLELKEEAERLGTEMSSEMTGGHRALVSSVSRGFQEASFESNMKKYSSTPPQITSCKESWTSKITFSSA